MFGILLVLNHGDQPPYEPLRTLYSDTIDLDTVCSIWYTEPMIEFRANLFVFISYLRLVILLEGLGVVLLEVVRAKRNVLLLSFTFFTGIGIEFKGLQRYVFIVNYAN